MRARCLERPISIVLTTGCLVVATAREGVASVPSLARLDWMWASVPVERVEPGGTAATPVSGLVADHARQEWYNPRPDGPTAVQEWDLEPPLTVQEGGDNNRQVLEWRVSPPTGQAFLGSEDWTGVTQAIAAHGADLSKSRFVEIWINDFTARHDSTAAILRLDLGRVSEDAFWSRTEAPNGRLDTEDKNRDGELDPVAATSPFFEDTGFDGVVSAQEPGFDPNTNRDPNGDDYGYDLLHSPEDYSTINNFEMDGLASPFSRPETEDLDHDGILDMGNDYFEATIDLSDTEYVAVDVPADYGTNGHVGPDNGWRLFHVPISAETFRAVGSPSWESVQHLRLWVGDVARPLTLQIGGIQIDGLVPPPAIDRVALHQNSPNPFNPATSIAYELEEASRVRLSVFDIHGRLVRRLVDAVQSAGPHSARWSGDDESGRAVASGIYVYQITTRGKQASRRMALVR